MVCDGVFLRNVLLHRSLASLGCQALPAGRELRGTKLPITQSFPQLHHILLLDSFALCISRMVHKE